MNFSGSKLGSRPTLVAQCSLHIINTNFSRNGEQCTTVQCRAEQLCSVHIINTNFSRNAEQFNTEQNNCVPCIRGMDCWRRCISLQLKLFLFLPNKETLTTKQSIQSNLFSKSTIHSKMLFFVKIYVQKTIQTSFFFEKDIVQSWEIETVSSKFLFKKN